MGDNMDYYLIARNRKNNKKIQIKLDDKIGTSLLHIDTLTTKFKDEQDLIKELINQKLINFIDADIYIEYEFGEKKFEEVIYEDMKPITQIPTITDYTYHKEDKTFLKAVDDCLVELTDKNVRDYVISSFKLNKQVKDNIKNYFNAFSEFDKNQLIDSLSTYKTFRDLKMVINELYQSKIAVDLEEIEELERLKLRRTHAKLIEFDYNKLPSSKEILEQVIQEHNNEREEFLNEDDYNQNYYPYNRRK